MSIKKNYNSVGIITIGPYYPSEYCNEVACACLMKNGVTGFVPVLMFFHTFLSGATAVVDSYCEVVPEETH